MPQMQTYPRTVTCLTIVDGWCGHLHCPCIWNGWLLVSQWELLPEAQPSPSSASCSCHHTFPTIKDTQPSGTKIILKLLLAMLFYHTHTHTQREKIIDTEY